ncbi:PDC sensor domain-containing protein, partial [Campylobacter concisus]|uniref:PDC sensor domain-containing protein n=1 Tax=Campylobacter concisus TaxID=199 RepID=UPI00130E1BE0
MRSISNKIALTLIVLLSVCFAAMSAVSYFNAKDEVVKLISQNQDQILSDIKSVTQSFIDDYMEDSQKLASKLVGSVDNKDEILARLKSTKENLKSIVIGAYFAAESNGYTYGSNGKTLTPEKDKYEPRGRGWYIAAKSSGKTIFTKPYIDMVAPEHDLCMTFSTPITEGSKLLGATFTDVNIRLLSKKLLKMGKTEFGYVYFMDKDGVILLHEDESLINSSVEATKTLAAKFASKDFDENGLISYKNAKNENVLAKILPINDEGWLAVAAINADTFTSQTMPLLKIQLILAVLFIVILSAFVYFLLKKSLNPIKTIQSKLD